MQDCAKCKILQEGETNNFLYKPEPHDFKVVQWECKMFKPLRCSDINKVNINKQIDSLQDFTKPALWKKLRPWDTRNC